MSRLAVFGYGSLASPASLAATLGRPVETAALARLPGWARGWTLGRDNLRSEKTFARADGSVPRYCLGLNLDPAPGAAGPNGVVVELSEAELRRLDLREVRYQRVDVSAAIAIDPGVRAPAFERVIAFRARREHHHPIPPADAVVLSTYPAAVEAAFAALGREQLDLFRATTPAPPVEVVEAALIRDRIPAGNPRRW
jgi:hypothetical protein